MLIKISELSSGDMAKYYRAKRRGLIKERLLPSGHKAVDLDELNAIPRGKAGRPVGSFKHDTWGDYYAWCRTNNKKPYNFKVLEEFLKKYKLLK